MGFLSIKPFFHTPLVAIRVVVDPIVNRNEARGSSLSTGSGVPAESSYWNQFKDVYFYWRQRVCPCTEAAECMGIRGSAL
jgi:hypothetical protein